MKMLIRSRLGHQGIRLLFLAGATLSNLGTASGFGKVLQVITATDSTNRSTTSTSFALNSSTLTVNITPSATSSKILVFLSCMLYIASSSSRLAIFRDDVNLADDAEDSHAVTDGNSAYYATSGMHVLDSPSSTSEITYQVRFKSNSGTSTTLTNQGAKGNITVIEIGA
jgi:hypothetical protein